MLIHLMSSVCIAVQKAVTKPVTCTVSCTYICTYAYVYIHPYTGPVSGRCYCGTTVSLQQCGGGHAASPSLLLMNPALERVQYCVAVPPAPNSCQVQSSPKVPLSLNLSSGQSALLNSQTNLCSARMRLLHLTLPSWHFSLGALLLLLASSLTTQKCH